MRKITPMPFTAKTKAFFAGLKKGTPLLEIAMRGIRMDLPDRQGQRYSERILKKSSLVDVVKMLRSGQVVCHEAQRLFARRLLEGSGLDPQLTFSKESKALLLSGSITSAGAQEMLTTIMLNDMLMARLTLQDMAMADELAQMACDILTSGKLISKDAEESMGVILSMSADPRLVIRAMDSGAITSFKVYDSLGRCIDREDADAAVRFLTAEERNANLQFRLADKIAKSGNASHAHEVLLCGNATLPEAQDMLARKILDEGGLNMARTVLAAYSVTSDRARSLLRQKLGYDI